MLTGSDLKRESGNMARVQIKMSDLMNALPQLNTDSHYKPVQCLQQYQKSTLKGPNRVQCISEGNHQPIRLWNSDMEGASWDVLIAPFHNEDVAALLFDCVGHVVHPVAHVLYIHLFTGCLWPVHTNH